MSLFGPKQPKVRAPLRIGNLFGGPPPSAPPTPAPALQRTEPVDKKTKTGDPMEEIRRLNKYADGFVGEVVQPDLSDSVRIRGGAGPVVPDLSEVRPGMFDVDPQQVQSRPAPPERVSLAGAPPTNRPGTIQADRFYVPKSADAMRPAPRGTGGATVSKPPPATPRSEPPPEPPAPAFSDSSFVNTDDVVDRIMAAQAAGREVPAEDRPTNEAPPHEERGRPAAASRPSGKSEPGDFVLVDDQVPQRPGADTGRSQSGGEPPRRPSAPPRPPPPPASDLLPAPVRGAAHLPRRIHLPRDQGPLNNNAEPEIVSFDETRLIDALRNAGVKESHIRVARQRQAMTKESLTDIMRTSEYGFLTPEKVAKVNAELGGYEYFSPRMADEVNAADLVEMLKNAGIEMRQFEGLVPVGISKSNSLVIAMAEPKDKNRALELFSGVRQDYVIASERVLQRMYRRFYARTGTEAMELYFKLRNAKVEQDGSEFLLREFVLTLMKHACYLGASDITFSPMVSDSGGVVRIKVDREGQVFTFLEKNVWERVISHIVSSHGAQEEIRKQPVDKKFDFKPADAEKFGEIMNRYGFRVAMIRRAANAAEGLTTIVMRILDQQADTSEMDQLGFDEMTLSQIRTICTSATGLFLVTGPTGSGKTTTLYAALNELDPVSHWIESIENPIEYSKGLWMQFQTPNIQGVDEAEGAHKLMKGLLRAAPEIILVGEVRNGEMGRALVDAANTGHLVLSTLHNNDAALAISRLKNFELDMSAVASLLRGILAQRLVKMLCSHCAVPDERIETNTYLDNLNFLKSRPERPTPYRPVGCINCNQTGYRGRRMVYELLVVTPKVRELIEQNEPPSKIARAGIPPDRTIIANGLMMVADGLTSLEEIQRLGTVEGL